jgi:putative transposase
MSDERVTRGVLPHWYRPGYANFVTYRLVDSIPADKMQQWTLERRQAIERGPQSGRECYEHRERVHKQFFAEYDRCLDAASTRCWLADPRVAAVIRENLYHHHGTKYELLAYCVMSNHVHVVLQPFERAGSDEVGRVEDSVEAGSFGNVAEAASFRGNFPSDEVRDSRSPLSSIMHSLKSYTANRANELLGRTGQFWQHESYDHWIRDLDELERIVMYVMQNPVQAGLCATPTDWAYSSAYDRFEIDGSDCGLVGTLRDDWRR